MGKTLLMMLIIATGIALGSSVSEHSRVALAQLGNAEDHQEKTVGALVRLETTKGVIRLAVHYPWSPHGGPRFVELVKQNYYNNSAIFRVIAGKFAQFGISGDPKVAELWRTRTIADDPRVESNVRGAVAFAFKDPNGRTTQVFINLRDNSEAFDKEPFVPFAKVIEGMEVADKLYSDYGEQAGGGIRGGKQDPLFKEGTDYLKRQFPKLDYITRATVESEIAY